MQLSCHGASATKSRSLRVICRSPFQICTFVGLFTTPHAHHWCSTVAEVSAMLLSMFGQIVIVGAGQAADQAVHTLRRKGFMGKLVVVGDEPWLPYQRPPLSKKFLAGALDRDRLVLRRIYAAWEGFRGCQWKNQFLNLSAGCWLPLDHGQLLRRRLLRVSHRRHLCPDRQLRSAATSELFQPPGSLSLPGGFFMSTVCIYPTDCSMCT